MCPVTINEYPSIFLSRLSFLPSNDVIESANETEDKNKHNVKKEHFENYFKYLFIQ